MTKHFCFPLFLPVPPSELRETSLKPSMVIIYGTFLLHFLKKYIWGVKRWKRRIWNTHKDHILYNHWTAIGQGEKSKHANPKHAALKNIIKSRNGQMSSFVELPWIIFLFCQLNNQDTEVTKEERNQEQVIILIASQSLKYKGLSLGVTWEVKLETSLQRVFY